LAVDPSVSNMGYVATALDPQFRAKPEYLPKSGAVDSATVKIDPLGRVHLVHDRDLLGGEPELVGDDLRDDRLMALALGCRAENRGDTPERIDLDRRRVDGARLRQVLGLGAELRVERGRDVAHVRDRRVHREGQADPEITAGRPRPRLLATELGVLRELERLLERRLVIARVVQTTRRSSVWKRVGWDEIPSPYLCRVQAELAGA